MREFRLDTVGPAGDCAVLVHLITDLGQVDFLDASSR